MAPTLVCHPYLVVCMIPHFVVWHPHFISVAPTLCSVSLASICWSGQHITSCCKQAVYKIPIIKTMVDTSSVDAIFFQPSDDIREDPFVLPDVLG